MGFLKNLKIDLPYGPERPLLGIYPEDPKSSYHRDTFISMFAAVLPITAKLQNPLRCSTIERRTQTT